MRSVEYLRKHDIRVAGGFYHPFVQEREATHLFASDGYGAFGTADIQSD